MRKICPFIEPCPLAMMEPNRVRNSFTITPESMPAGALMAHSGSRSRRFDGAGRHGCRPVPLVYPDRRQSQAAPLASLGRAHHGIVSDAVLALFERLGMANQERPNASRQLSRARTAGQRLA